MHTLPVTAPCLSRPHHSYEKLKTWFADKDGKLSVPARLAAGAGAAAISTLVRHTLPQLCGGELLTYTTHPTR